MENIDISEVRQVVWRINDIRNYAKKLKSEIKSGDAYGVSSIMEKIILNLQAISEHLSSLSNVERKLIDFLWEIYKEIIKMILELEKRLILDALTFESKDTFSVQTLDAINRLHGFLENLF
jgi:hypothetical protein